MVNQQIFLWPDAEAPYTSESPDQAQPSLKAFEAEGAKIAVVVCPGGGYVCKADHEGDPVAQRLNLEGISGYVLDYRVKPCHPMAPLADAQRAIRAVRGMGYRYVGILGFSAGANLACTAATHYDAGDPDAGDAVERLSCRPDFFVPCYPVVSFHQFPNIGSVNARPLKCTSSPTAPTASASRRTSPTPATGPRNAPGSSSGCAGKPQATGPSAFQFPHRSGVRAPGNRIATSLRS